jgi:hypothetical protein
MITNDTIAVTINTQNYLDVSPWLLRLEAQLSLPLLSIT